MPPTVVLRPEWSPSGAAVQGGHARRGGSPCLFPLQLFSLCWVLSVAQSKTVRYSTFEEDAPGTVIGTLAEDG